MDAAQAASLLEDSAKAHGHRPECWASMRAFIDQTLAEFAQTIRSEERQAAADRQRAFRNLHGVDL